MDALASLWQFYINYFIIMNSIILHFYIAFLYIPMAKQVREIYVIF